MQEIEQSPWAWTLYRHDDGALELLVVCGTVGIFEVAVRLDADTTARYAAEGRPVLERLARQVSRDPHGWLAGRRSVELKPDPG